MYSYFYNIPKNYEFILDNFYSNNLFEFLKKCENEIYIEIKNQ